jgi:hypothetical protein
VIEDEGGKGEALTLYDYSIQGTILIELEQCDEIHLNVIDYCYVDSNELETAWPQNSQKNEATLLRIRILV